MLNLHLSKNLNAISWYLEETILSQITYAPEQLVCSPSHLMRGFRQSICFTATPGHSLAYAHILNEIRRDNTFEAAVITQFCDAANKEKIYSVTTHPKNFFKELLKNDPKLFYKVHVLNDPGGYFGDYTNREVIDALHALMHDSQYDIPLDGWIFFKDPKGLAMNKEETLLLWLKNEVEPFEVEGSDVKEALKKRGLNWEKLNLGTFYDPPHTLATNIPQKPLAEALLFAGPKLTRSHMIQAIFRMRGFLKQQRIRWVFLKDLADKIPKGSKKELSAPAILAWVTKNEAEELKKKILMMAFEEIRFIVESPARQEIKQALHDPLSQLTLFQKYQHGFIEKVSYELFKDYSDPLKTEKTRTVLLNYAKLIYEKFGYSTAWNKATDILKAVEMIISATENVVTEMATQQRAFTKEIQNHHQLKKETKQSLIRPRLRNVEGMIEPPIYANLYESNFLENMLSHSYAVQTVFDTDKLSSSLYISEKQLTTARLGHQSLKEEYRKPIDYILIFIKPPMNRYAFAISDTEASAFKEQLSTFSCKAVLFRADGVVEKKGSKLDLETLNAMQNSEWFKNIIVDVALFNGQVRYPELLVKKLATWTHFEIFWNKVVNSMANPETANTHAVKSLLPTRVSELR